MQKSELPVNFYDLLRSHLDDDDEFFHITCHINQTLRARIARGEFVDLDQLVPKDNKGGMMSYSKEENKIEIVSSGVILSSGQ